MGLKKGFGLISTLGAVVFIFGFSVVSLAQTEKGVVAYYDFDEGSGSIAHDKSGNNNTGEIHGATWVDGISNKALLFDGNSNSYVNCGNDRSLSCGSNDVTISVWVKANDLTDAMDILTKGSEYKVRVGGGYRRGGEEGTSSVIMFVEDWDTYLYSGAIGTGIWTFITYVKTGKKLHCFINGVFSDSSRGGKDIPLSVPVSEAVLSIGGGNFKGLIDEVRIYNRALSKEEIQEHYKVRTEAKEKETEKKMKEKLNELGL